MSVQGMAGKEKYFGKLIMYLNRTIKQTHSEPKIWYALELEELEEEFHEHK